MLKFFFFLNKRFLFSFFLLIFSIFIGSFLELISLASIIPILEIIRSKSINNLNPTLNEFVKYLNINSYEDLLLIVSFSIIFIFFIKFLINNINSFYVVKFASRIKVDLTKNMMQFYLKKNYKFFINNNSNNLVQNTLLEARILADRFYLASLFILIDSLILFSIILFLFFYNFQLTLILITLFFLFSYFYLFFTKKIIKNIGQERADNEKVLLRRIKEIFQSIKEIKSYSAEDYFTSRINILNLKNEINYKYLNLFQSLPRTSFDFISILIIFTIVFVEHFYFSNNNLITNLIILSAAIIRIVPAVNRILSCIQDIKFSNSTIKIFKNHLREETNDSLNSLNSNHLVKIVFKDRIKFQNVDFAYNLDFNNSKSDRYIFKDLNLEIEKNTSIGIFGESGSGKTTFVDLLMGLLHPTSGSVSVDNINLNKVFIDRKSLFGYVPQKIFLIDDTIKKNIAIGADIFDEEKIHNVLKLVNLDSYALNSKYGIEASVGDVGMNLSGGQIQRIGIARALYFNSDILVFDESCNQLDADNQKKIIDIIKNFQGKKTIIYISHDLQSIEFCSSIYKVEDKNLKKC
jgi:ABC-type bacteriocin/lantibiotic exporter with double-glycine peptidase domain